MAKINDLPLLTNPTEDMYCLVGKGDLQKVPWSAIMGQIGAPYIATTAAGMTDKTRVYVYQGSESGYTSGNWYYWNGSAWTSGGTYNSAAVDTDKTLTQSDKSADSAVVGKEIGQLKESISDLTDTIISINKSNVSVNVDNYENIESTIIKSNGKLESNSYTARFVVKKYINLTKASYTVKGFCQGDQCLYVLCDKNGDVIKYEDSTSQGSSGTKTVDITIDERDTILYVGGYETVIAVVKKYLYDVKLTKRLSNIYRKKSH